MFANMWSTFFSLRFSPQDPLESGAALEATLGMDMDAEAVRDAENNINTARWVGLMCHFNLTSVAA